MQSEYLLKRDGRFYFRIRVPLDLRRWFAPREEIKKSLKTNGYNGAKCLVRVWIYRSEQLFAQLRALGITDIDPVRHLLYNQMISLLHNGNV